MKKTLHLIFQTCLLLLKLVGFLIHLWSIVIIYGWTESLLLCGIGFFFPLLTQVALIFGLWRATGTFFTPFTIVVLGFLITFIVIAYLTTVTESDEEYMRRKIRWL